MKNIYMFSIGKMDVANGHKEKLEKMGYNVTIGPSKEEDKFLEKKYKYYKKAKKLKKYPFMSDIWSLYILSKNKGLYTDISVEIGDNFSEFFDDVSRYEAWFPKTTSITAQCSVMFSNKSNIYGKLLGYYEKKYKGQKIMEFPALPRILSGYLYAKELLIKDEFDAIIKDGIAIETIGKIVNKKTIRKYGWYSWGPNGESKHSGKTHKKWARNMRRKKEDMRHLNAYGDQVLEISDFFK